MNLKPIEIANKLQEFSGVNPLKILDNNLL